MAKPDDQFWEEIRRSKQQERDRRRDNAQWVSPAERQRDLHHDDKEFLKGIQELSDDVGKLTDQELEERIKKFEKTGRRKGWDNDKIKRAKQQVRAQKKSSGCAVVIASGGMLIFGAYEIVSRLV